MKEGLGLNEFRFKNSQINRVKKKLWNIEKVLIEKSKNILVIKEQGIGDEITIRLNVSRSFNKKFY